MIRKLVLDKEEGMEQRYKKINVQTQLKVLPFSVKWFAHPFSYQASGEMSFSNLGWLGEVAF